MRITSIKGVMVAYWTVKVDVISNSLSLFFSFTIHIEVHVFLPVFTVLSQQTVL